MDRPYDAEAVPHQPLDDPPCQLNWSPGPPRGDFDLRPPERLLFDKTLGNAAYCIIRGDHDHQRYC